MSSCSTSDDIFTLLDTATPTTEHTVKKCGTLICINIICMYFTQVMLKQRLGR